MKNCIHTKTQMLILDITAFQTVYTVVTSSRRELCCNTFLEVTEKKKENIDCNKKKN